MGRIYLGALRHRATWLNIPHTSECNPASFPPYLPCPIFILQRSVPKTEGLPPNRLMQ